MSETQETNKELIENQERLTRVARNVVDCFDFDPTKESFLFITDSKVMDLNPHFVGAIRQELETRTGQQPRTKGNYEMVVVPPEPRSAAPFGEKIGDKMKDRPVLIVTSMSRSHSKETSSAIRADVSDKSVFDDILSSEKFQQTVDQGHSYFTKERVDELGGKLSDSMYDKLKTFAKKRRIRLISITKGHNPYEILTRGAVEESVDVLRHRAEYLSQKMSDVKRVHITSISGTDFWLNPRTDKTEVEDGKIDKPGSLANYPIGEWACSPFIEGADGLIVVDGPIGGNHNLDQINELGPLRVEVKAGHIVSLNGSPLDVDSGNPLAESVKAYLASGNNQEGHAFRIAELGIGTNGKACQGKTPENIGSSEGEKIYGTCHIAFGSNGTFGIERDDPNLNAVPIHCDMVLQEGLTVECEQQGGGKFNLIDQGIPQGY
ncbi:MAG: hypothetical protein WC575_03150 [Patescibacteria group bacterium]